MRIVGKELAAWLAAALAVGLTACGGSSGSSGNICSTGSCTVGAAGATVSLPSGPTLEIPSGALASDTPVTIAQSTTPAPSGAVTALYQFGPSGTAFSSPVTVRFSVPPGSTSSTVAIHWTKPGSTTDYDVLPTTVANGIASASVSHFSLGYVAALSASCVDMSGTWTITQHCSAAYVGKSGVLAQNGCTATTTDPVTGDARTLQVSGSTVTMGSACSGSVSGDTWTWSCDGCAQTLVRQAACVPGQACTPSGAPDPCKTYATACDAGGNQTCVAAGNAADGTACGTGLVCTAGTCGALTCEPAPITGSTVAETRIAEAKPAPTGGVIADGAYDMTGMYIYTGPGGASGPTGASYRCTLVVSGTVLQETCGSGATGTPSTVNFSVSGNQYTITSAVCGTADVGYTVGYTATPTELRTTSVDGTTGRVVVYTRRGATTCVPNQACTPSGTPDPCKTYATACDAGGNQTCVAAGNAADGTSCGSGLVCSAGTCVSPPAALDVSGSWPSYSAAYTVTSPTGAAAGSGTFRAMRDVTQVGSALTIRMAGSTGNETTCTGAISGTTVTASCTIQRLDGLCSGTFPLTATITPGSPVRWTTNDFSWTWQGASCTSSGFVVHVAGGTNTRLDSAPVDVGGTYSVQINYTKTGPNLTPVSGSSTGTRVRTQVGSGVRSRLTTADATYDCFGPVMGDTVYESCLGHSNTGGITLSGSMVTLIGTGTPLVLTGSGGYTITGDPGGYTGMSFSGSATRTAAGTCAPGTTCSPSGSASPCRVYATSCDAGGVATCGSFANVTDGTLCGTGLACSAGACVSAGGGTVTGVVIGEALEPLAGVTVVATGAGPVTTAADGTFSIPNVAATYRLTAYSAARQEVAILEGLTVRSGLVVWLGYDAALPQPESTGQISGTVSNAPGGTVSYSWDFVGPEPLWPGSPVLAAGGAYGPTSMGWLGTSPLSATAYLLATSRDVGGNPIGYRAASRGFTLHPGQSLTGVDLPLVALPSMRASGNLTVPASVCGGSPCTSIYLGLSLQTPDGGYLGTWGSSIPTASSTYSVPSPDGAAIGAVFGAQAEAYGALGTSDAGYIALTPAAGRSITLQDPPSYTAPASGATGVGPGTAFSWTTPPGAVHRVFWRCGTGATAMSLVLLTSASSVSLPDLAGTGVTWPSGSFCSWQVSTSGPVSIDQYAARSRRLGDWFATYGQSASFTTR